jgi:hypothetical protein
MFKIVPSNDGTKIENGQAPDGDRVHSLLAWRICIWLYCVVIRPPPPDADALAIGVEVVHSNALTSLLMSSHCRRSVTILWSDNPKGQREGACAVDTI